MDFQDLLAAQAAGNNGENKPKSPLLSLKQDLEFYSESIKEVSSEMLAEEYTSFPIFIASQQEVNLGEKILDQAELGTAWTIYASSLEEFLDRGLIKDDRQDFFIKKYKDPKEFMCLFVVVPEGANYVFHPYKT